MVTHELPGVDKDDCEGRNVAVGEAKATFKSGVLKIELPKTGERRSGLIPVR